MGDWLPVFAEPGEVQLDGLPHLGQDCFLGVCQGNTARLGRARRNGGRRDPGKVVLGPLAGGFPGRLSAASCRSAAREGTGQDGSVR